MDTLINPFNLSVNACPDGNSVLLFLNCVSFIMLHNMIRKVCNEVFDMHTKNNTAARMKIYEYIYDDFFEDVNVSTDRKKELLLLLDINSLDRHYILYYIFKLDGCTDTIYNTKRTYEIINNTWLIDSCCVGTSSMNLDETIDKTLDNDYLVALDDEYTCTKAHVRFLSWIHYSGIYDYLINNNKLKMKVLNEMNARQLLTGNLFLKYHLYLIEMDKQEQDTQTRETDVNSTIDDNEPCDISENLENENTLIERKLEEQTPIESELEDVQDNDQDDEQDNERNDEQNDENYNYEDENETILNERLITESIDDISELGFVIRLVKSVKNIMHRTFINVLVIVREEMTELFN